jgi:hypothetical protein
MMLKIIYFLAAPRCAHASALAIGAALSVASPAAHVSAHFGLSTAIAGRALDEYESLVYIYHKQFAWF